MNYKVLYRKYRPNDFESLVGQPNIVKILKTSIIESKISHAYIFTGPRGTGKTSTARIFAKAINCLNPVDGNPCNKCENCKQFEENPDIVEIDAASNNGVDEIRELINNVKLSPTMSKYKVYIIDEFHMLSTSAFNALLLTLEEPPSNVVFILATTDIQNVPITVLSRCQRFDFKLIIKEEMSNRLKFICEQEKIKITDQALNEIVYLSNGGLRDALSILDQISSDDKEITIEDVNDMFGGISNHQIELLMKAYENAEAEEIAKLATEFKANGVNYVVLINKIVLFLKNILIKIKTNTYNGSLQFDDIYNLINDLTVFNNNPKNLIDSFDYLVIVFLKYMNNANKVENKNILKGTEDNESIEEKPSKLKNDESILLKENKESESTNTNKCTLNVDARINNCFVNAQKKYLNDVKIKWADFITYELNANKKLMSIILDTELVAISDAYGIVVNELESTVALINENISSFETDFKNFYGNNIKFVALSNEKWKISKADYINNLKNNVKYSIINEDPLDLNIQNDTSNDKLESLANEIFGNNVEIK